MKTGIVICTRLDSERIPNKPFRKINGVSILQNLINRLHITGLQIILAVPINQLAEYEKEFAGKNVFFYDGYGDDPLRRMSEAAKKYKLDAVVRITHDKILVRHRDISEALEEFRLHKADYVFGSQFVPGTGFEIIRSTVLHEAAKKYSKVEFIGYAVRTLSNSTIEYKPKHPLGDYRLLIDYPEDIQLFDVIFSQCGNDVPLEKAIVYLNEHPELKQINRLPKLTVYTCAHNAEKWINQCINSVAKQRMFNSIEYIIIDDFSSDKTSELIAKFACRYHNVRWIRNTENLGLASSSNIALKASKGDYILRLDADDYFVSFMALEEMLKAITTSNFEVIYPDNYLGNLNVIQDGNKSHHVGGAIFDKRAINFIKFTDGLRNYDGLDLWARARDKLKIGYLKKPIFFYTQHDQSMSKTNLREREQAKKDIVDKYLSYIDEDFNAEI